MWGETDRQFGLSSVRPITSAPVRGVFSWLLFLLAVPIVLGSLLQACGGSSGGPAPSNIESITIDPINPSVAVGTKIQLHATVNFKNKTTEDVTESVTWSSSDSKVVHISNVPGTKGLSSGAGAGTTTIKVAFKGKTGRSTFTVTLATLKSITVEPAEPVIAKGTSVQLSAFGNFSDGSAQDLTTQVSWSSGNSGIAQVSDASPTNGLVSGVTGGNAPITASLNGIQGSTTVTVTTSTLTSITVTPADPTIARGTTVQLIATCNFADGTTEDCTSQVGWTSANNSIASVSTASGTKGLVTGVGAGSALITATLSGVSGSTTVTVTTATLTSITVTPVNPTVAKGTTLQLTAAGTFSDGSTQNLTTQVSWTSAVESTAQVSNVSGSQGLVTGLVVGSTPIAAALNGIEGSTTVTVSAATLTSIAVTPANPSIVNGTEVSEFATCSFSDSTAQDCTSQVSWTSSNNSIAPVSDQANSKGLVKGTSVGIATITATLEGVSGSTGITVTSGTLISITVTPADQSINTGGIIRLIATGLFSNGTHQDITTSASWISSNTAVATVGSAGNDPGLVTGIGAGGAVITATVASLAPGLVSGSTTVTVAPAEFAYLTDDFANTVSVFSVGSNGTLTAVGPPITNPGKGAASVTADPSGKFLYTANQGDGSVTAYAITQSGPGIGSLTLIDNIPSGGTGSFGIGVVPSGNFAYVGNVNDTVSGFAINPGTGALSPVAGSPFPAAPISAPQGIAAHPNDQFIYVAGSGSNNVGAYSLNPTTGAITAIPGSPFAPGTPVRDPVSVTLDPLGNHLFTANSFPAVGAALGSVSSFIVNPNTGALSWVENVPVGTKAGGPAMVAVDPSSKFAYVAGGLAGGVTAFIIEKAGTLTLIPGSPFVAGVNTIWVTVDPTGKFVYAANHSFIDSTLAGGVSAYSLNPVTGVLTALPGVTLPPGPSSMTVIAVP